MSVESINKSAIAKSFGNAAEKYDSVAHFQRNVGYELLAKIPQTNPKCIVDLGCGTGYFLSNLETTYPSADLIGLDLSEEMVRFARKANETHAADTNIVWLVGDGEKLPFKSGSVDLIFSSLAIQWCGSLSLLFNEIQRVLSKDGVFVFSSLVDGSLCELKSAWSQVDGMQHVNAFAYLADYQQAVSSTSLSTAVLDVEEKVLYYKKVKDLTRELKTLGAHNMTSHRVTHLTGKQRIQQFLAAYESFRLSDGTLPASYQVLFGVLTNE
ncbi:MAG: malonyl-CoA O-methyltransferase [Oleiphilaceae bacterium]|jgi:malonyl-CoA O-methyltransferase